MNMKTILPWVLVVALGIAVFALYSSNQKQSAELAQLRQQSEEAQKAQAPADTKSPAATEEELTQLRKDHEDVLRLRNEVRTLRDEKQQLARQAPGRVRRLVLAATGPGLGGVPGSPRALLALATPRRYHQPDYYRSVAGRVYGGAARRDPDALLHGSLARFIEPPSIRGYLGQLYAITGWTSLPWLHTLRQPTLVLNGDDDPIVPPINGRILAHCIPDARLHVVHGAGHLFLLERPAEMAALVTGFLAEEP